MLEKNGQAREKRGDEWVAEWFEREATGLPGEGH
jgi:hypothetical protein